MIFLQSVITALYYGLVAWAAVLIAYSFWRAKTWEREVLYLIVLVPFLLRALFLK
ncbi:MAG: hypothetical protein NTY02_13560 [Acidobacteria bacterium]|nr:hypothetical protein [Acidobacteriota bacterium]